MQLRRNYSTRDFFINAFFGLVVIGTILALGVVLWTQGRMPVNTHDPLSVLGVSIFVLIFILSLIIALKRLKAPWYTSIACNGDTFTILARNSKDNIVVKKSDLVSTELIHSSIKGVSYVGVKISHKINGKQSYFIIGGTGSWKNPQSGIIYTKKNSAACGRHYNCFS